MERYVDEEGNALPLKREERFQTCRRLEEAGLKVICYYATKFHIVEYYI